MNIKVGFSRHKGFAPLSWLIMACERTKFSHSFIEFYSKSLDRYMIYHATGSGVYFVGKTLFEEYNTIIKYKEVEVSKEVNTKLLQWCVDKSGLPYSRAEVFQIGVRRFFRLFGIRIAPMIQNRASAYICSELVAEALAELGYQIDRDQLDVMGLQELEALLATALKDIAYTEVQ